MPGVSTSPGGSEKARGCGDQTRMSACSAWSYHRISCKTLDSVVVRAITMGTESAPNQEGEGHIRCKSQRPQGAKGLTTPTRWSACAPGRLELGSRVLI